MLAATVVPDRASSDQTEGSLPMRGAVLAALASAFRLGDKVRTQASRFSAGTAKRILQDAPAVSTEMRTELSRALVGHLFTMDYLRARGLEDSDAHLHNEAIVAALEDLLDRWEVVARWSNHMEHLDMAVEHLLAVNGLDVDLAARAAAYLCLYPRLHPVLGSLEAWLAKPGLSGAFEELMKRAGQRISLERLGKDTRLTKNTLKGIRDGKGGEPQGETLEHLAHAFAKHHVPRRDGEGDATSAEIELDLRAAAALGRVREALSSDALRTALGIHLMLVRHLRSELRRYTPEELTTLLVRGPASPLWPPVKGMIHGHLQAVMGQYAASLAADARRRELLFQRDPAAAARELQEGLAAHLESLRAAQARLRRGHLEVLDPIVDLMDDLAELFRDIEAHREGKEASATAFVSKTNDEKLKACGLLMNAVAPWENHNPAEKERLLREAVAVCPSFPDARIQLAFDLAERGRHAEAIAHLYAVVSERPDNPEARYNLALWLSCMGQDAEALAELEELDRRGGYGADADALRGDCLLALKRVAEAEAAFARALASNDRLVMALSGMATCCRLAGDERKARELERRATYYGTPLGESAPRVVL